MPFLEEGARYASYDLSKLTIDEPNLSVTEKPLPIYTCPSMILDRDMPMRPCGELLGPGSYLISTRVRWAAYTNLDGPFVNPPVAGCRYECGIRRITDGTFHTLLVGETNFGFANYLWDQGCGVDGMPRWGDHTWAEGYWFSAWGHTGEGRSYNFNDTSATWDSSLTATFRSDHPGGVQFILLDGSVQFLRSGVTKDVLFALVTRAGEEVHASFP